MRRIKKAIVFGAIATTVLGAGAGMAGAHDADVTTPSGEENCQFMGGPGNPGHAGHGNGHTVAQSNEQSDSYDVGDC